MPTSWTNWLTTTTLYEHQRTAVDKLRSIRVGALFMEMGTGKTRAAIELMHIRRNRIDRVLWFCPVSLKETIRYELRKHTDLPAEALCVFDDRTSMRNVPRDALVYVIGVESIGQSNRVTLAANDLITDQTFVIVDESSYIKSHYAKRTERITTMAERAKYRLLLTGTPISQGVVDLFAQMRFLSPSILGYQSYYSFAANHLEYSEKYPGMIVRSLKTDHLATKIQPYVYQVTKDECLDLPAKVSDVRYYLLTEQQQIAYNQAKDELLPLDQEVGIYDLFKLFTALQEIVSGFWNRRRKTLEFKHERLDVLARAINSIPDDQPVIIWCKFQYSVRQICAMLRELYGDASVSELHGTVSGKDREAAIERWRQGKARFLVATQATGGHGLTLTEAHYAIFYENGFKYAERAQAEDRIHRIGQEHKCTYIDLVAVHSIDERIQSALSKKADVVADFRDRVQQVKDAKDKEALKALVLEL